MSISSVLCPSHLNNDVATSSTLIHSSGTARLGGYTRHSNTDSINSLDLCFQSDSSFFPSPFVDVLFEYVLEYTDIQLFLHSSTGTWKSHSPFLNGDLHYER